MTFDGRASLPPGRGACGRDSLTSHCYTVIRELTKNHIILFHGTSKLYLIPKYKIWAQKRSPEATQRDSCYHIGSRHRRLNEFLCAKRTRVVVCGGAAQAQAARWRSTIAPSNTRPIPFKGFVPLFLPASYMSFIS